MYRSGDEKKGKFVRGRWRRGWAGSTVHCTVQCSTAVQCGAVRGLSLRALPPLRGVTIVIEELSVTQPVSTTCLITVITMGAYLRIV